MCSFDNHLVPISFVQIFGMCSIVVLSGVIEYQKFKYPRKHQTIFLSVSAIGPLQKLIVQRKMNGPNHLFQQTSTRNSIRRLVEFLVDVQQSYFSASLVEFPSKCLLCTRCLVEAIFLLLGVQQVNSTGHPVETFYQTSSRNRRFGGLLSTKVCTETSTTRFHHKWFILLLQIEEHQNPTAVDYSNFLALSHCLDMWKITEIQLFEQKNFKSTTFQQINRSVNPTVEFSNDEVL